MMQTDKEITLIQICTCMSLNYNGFKIVCLKLSSLVLAFYDLYLYPEHNMCVPKNWYSFITDLL